MPSNTLQDHLKFMGIITKEKVLDDITNVLGEHKLDPDQISANPITQKPHSSVWSVSNGNNKPHYVIKYFHHNKIKAEREYKLFKLTRSHFKQYNRKGVPKPLSYSNEKGILVTKKIPGKTTLLNHQLNKVFLSPSITTRNITLVKKTGKWLRRFQKIEFPSNYELPTYNRSNVQISDLIKSASNSVDPAIDLKKLHIKLQEIETQWTQDKLVFCHRDFTPWNVLFTNSDKIVLVDFATTCKGDPEYDPARFLTMLRIASIYTSKKNILKYTKSFLEGYKMNLNYDKLYYWRVIHILTWLNRIDQKHMNPKAVILKYKMMKNLNYDLFKLINLKLH